MAGKWKTELKLYTVDAFSSQPFAGNPAAVCPLEYQFGRAVDDTVLQNIAMEMNLSETAYIQLLSPTDDFKTADRFGLRWFTPRHEIKLCGHATLASAAVLFYRLGNESKEITFKTLSGDLMVKVDGDYLAMDFPLGVTEMKDASDCKAIIKSFGKVPGVQDVRWCPSLKYLLFRLQDGWSRSEFEEWSPDLGQLEKSTEGVIVVIVTTCGPPDQGYVDDWGKPYDFLSRCFAPWSGVPEDPVTGSAQTVLADYWVPKLGKNSFYTRQCSKRGGEIDIKVTENRVCLRGKAAIVLNGVLRI